MVKALQCDNYKWNKKKLHLQLQCECCPFIMQRMKFLIKILKKKEKAEMRFHYLIAQYNTAAAVCSTNH